MRTRSRISALKKHIEQRNADITAGNHVPPIPAQVHQAPDQDDQDVRAGADRYLMLDGFADLSRLLLQAF
jgi:hypothetical protein